MQISCKCHGQITLHLLQIPLGFYVRLSCKPLQTVEYLPKEFYNISSWNDNIKNIGNFE